MTGFMIGRLHFGRAIAIICALGLIVGVLILVPDIKAAAGINRQINFQGKVVNSNGTNVTDNTYSFVFSLYDAASDGNQLWTETQSVPVANGIFRVSLGAGTSFPADFNFNRDDLYLEVNFNSDGPMAPRIRFTAVPYALNAEKVAGLTVTNTTGTLTIPNGKTISFADAFTTSGAYPLTLTVTNTTNATLPTGSITLVDTASTQTLTNKTIGNAGDLLYFDDATGNASISGLLTISGTSAVIETEAKAPLTIGSSTTGSIQLSPGGSSGLYIDGEGSVGIGSLLPVGKLDVSGAVIGKALTILNETGDQDILVASAGGQLRFSVGNTGSLYAPSLNSDAGTALVITANNEIVKSSSSIRYKTDIASLSDGLDIINQLRPVTFRWKSSGTIDFGFVAEEVANINPLFVTFGQGGVVEGVKYAQLTAVLVNAIKQQQDQLDFISEQTAKLATDTATLMDLVVKTMPDGSVTPGGFVSNDMLMHEIDLSKIAISSEILRELDNKIASLSAVIPDITKAPVTDKEAEQPSTPSAQILSIQKVVQQVMEFLDTVMFKGKVEFFTNVFFRGHITVNHDTVGYAVIPRFATYTYVTFDSPYETPPLVTISVELKESTDSAFLGDSAKAAVSNVSEFGFRIVLDSPVPRDVRYNWIALAVPKKMQSAGEVAGMGVVVSPTPVQLPTYYISPTVYLTPSVIPSSTKDSSPAAQLLSRITLPIPTPTPDDRRTVTIAPNDFGFVRIRELSSTISAELGTIPVGEDVPVSEEEYGWIRVEYQGVDGWISQAYIAKEEE